MSWRSTGAAALLCGAALLGGVTYAAGSKEDAAGDVLARSLYQQLIDLNTTDTPAGNVTPAAEAMAQRLRAAGFPAADVRVLGPNERKKNMVVRLHGSGQHKPLLIIGHLDVVDARREDWSTDPFKLLEKDGYFYGRGSIDMKSNDAIAVASLIRLHQENFRPTRDIILALTADEEGGCCNGVEWLLKNRRPLVEAEFVVNLDDYSVVLDHGVPQFFSLVASEKVYADFQLSVTGPGGHSSEPGPDNVIYTLTHALDRLSGYQFPFELNAATRGYFERRSDLEPPQRAADMRAILKPTPDAEAVRRISQNTYDEVLLRTTCVTTRLSGGHANNALPQRAEAVVNCRILPGHSPEEVRQQLLKVLAEPKVTVSYLSNDGTTVLPTAPEQRGYSPPALLPQMLAPLEQVVGQMWPHLKVIPTMSAGASDAVYTAAAGIPTYTFSGLAVDPEDDHEHGRDERLGVQSFYDGNQFFYRYLRLVGLE
jgi:acetylornithine deacetylase/succinyl-diaminopimelate desuccinylase-like protein